MSLGPYRGGRISVSTTTVLLVGLLFVPASLAETDCNTLWTVAGKGSEEPWLRVNGYRIGMAKSQAAQIRRAGMTTTIAHDKWVLDLEGTYVAIEFQNDRMVSATVTLVGRDFQEAYAAVIEQMGPPDDFGQDYVLWRSEACDTMKILKEDQGRVVIAIQKLSPSSSDKKTKKKRKK